MPMMDRETQSLVNRYPAPVDDATRRAKAAAMDMIMQRKVNAAQAAAGKDMGMKKGGKVSSASSRADGCAQRGKTKGTMIMCKGGKV
jgi:hypothetical protein